MNLVIINRISSLLEFLPEHDVSIGQEYLMKNNFNALKELVDSAIYKVKKSLNSGNEEYSTINLNALKELKVEIDMYADVLETEDNFDKYDEFEDYLL